jgi:hypothetical protein
MLCSKHFEIGTTLLPTKQRERSQRCYRSLPNTLQKEQALGKRKHTMTTKRYQAIEVRQQPDAPPMYMIRAAARELLEWCDVPRTKEHYMAGYQRVLTEDRLAEIAEYLKQSSNNTLPGAIIVAADAEYVSVHNDGAKQEKEQEKDEGAKQQTEAQEERKKREEYVFIEIRDDTRDFKTKLEELFGAFSTRLSNEELASADISFSSSDETEEYDNSEYPSSYLAKLAKELQDALTRPEDLPPERMKAIEDYISGVSKPGLIIDGQHRVLGAKNVSDHDVMLPVVVMLGLPHQEQVFQFYVLNSKAKPLRPTELRRIVSTSLTNSEIEGLYNRFRNTGLDPEEARWTYQMHNSPHSVFRGLIDFGFGNVGEIIPENVTDQLVRSFMKMPRSRYASLMDSVRKRWDDDDERLQIFFDLWKAVSNVYADAWDEALVAAKQGKLKQIFTKVALLTLQKFLLDRFVTALPFRERGAPPPFQDEVSTKGMVVSTLENLPSKFFMQEWKMKQMDTSAGREQLYDQMSKAWDNQGRNIGNLTLFRG